ncbi:MAG: response regulator [Anaerolineae bacterium]|nr:response regulator [Anaerolineae bacterium]
MEISTFPGHSSMLNMDVAVYPMQTVTRTKVISPRILIADDDIESMMLLGGLLKSDYGITYARNGEETLILLEEREFDLVMLDLVMSGMDGLDVLAKIRAKTATRDLPVILISGVARHDAIVKGLQNGANDYISKPYDTDIVRARIKNQLAMKRLLDEREQTIVYLRNSHEVKDRFLRIATHDLKSPLNSIQLAQYYLRTVIGNDPSAIDALDVIEDTVNTMSELVEDFLDTSALETGKTDLQLEPVEAESALWDVIARYSATANKKNITLLMGKCEGDAMADKARLAQMIGNLVSNAIKYSSPDQIITVSSRVIRDKVRFFVADEGPGIKPDERSRLFQAFSKLSNRPTGGEHSTGLGLWIVKELAQMHQGAAGADFPRTGGSIFWVEVPAKKE